MTFLNFGTRLALSLGKPSISRNETFPHDNGIANATLVSKAGNRSTKRCTVLPLAEPSQGLFRGIPRLNADNLECRNSWQATREKLDYVWKLAVIAILVFLPFFIGRFCTSRSFFHPFGVR